MGDIDLRLGRWQDVLADVECDALITDPPYSDKTHAGHDSGAAAGMDARGADYRKRTNGKPTGGTGPRQAITYAAWGEDDVNAFVDHWGPRTKGWIAVVTDHVLAPIFAGALAMPENGGRYVFAPIPIVETGSRVRLTGDGPSSWTCWLVIGRPKREPYSKWGTLPGAYIGAGKGDRMLIGGKDSTIMRSIIRDYSRPNDLVCDPTAGAGTTLLAAAMEGRRAIGAECDPKHFDIATKRLREAVITPPLFVDTKPHTQTKMEIE